VWQRSIGAYQVAHHCRQHGFTVQVIDFTDFFDEEELTNIIKKFLSKELFAIGLSTTFYSTLDKEENPALASNAGSNLRSSVVLDEKICSAFKLVKDFNKEIKIIAGGANSWQFI
jgi:hypothetical protein